MDDQSLWQAALNATGQLVSSIVAKRVQRMKQGENPDKSPSADPTHLAHYTTADGLRGIIQSGTLWASGAYYLNDSSEIDYGCRLFTEILGKAIAEEGRDPVSKRIFEDAKKAFEPGGFMESVVNRTYIACFCENENLLSQWRAYGRKGGYSLIFPHEALRSSLTVHDDFYYVELQRVIYNRDVQVRLLELVIADVMTTLAEKSIVELWKGFNAEQKKLFFISFNTLFHTIAVNDIVRLKHPAFEEEREWRLIVRPKSPNLSHQEVQQLQFRTGRGTIIPYLELRPKEGTLLPVASLRYGPTLEQKQAVNSLRLLFQRKGYSVVRFDGSEIPVAL
jgi:hypothetical protein